MVGFGEYLKDYLEFNNITQVEFAKRLGITQKHLNEILNGKQDITAEMATNIERLTAIDTGFILRVENNKRMEKDILKKYKTEAEFSKFLNKNFGINDIKKSGWIKFKDETSPIQKGIDILDYLKVVNFDALSNLNNRVLYKKSGENYNKIALWIARCDELSREQKVKKYVKENIYFIIEDLRKIALKPKYAIDEIQNILNQYGIYFVKEKALPSTKIRGCFKVKLNNPAIYLTDNYSGKDSLFFELFHELGHCKSDYNMGKNKVIIEGTEEQEKRADNFALNMMISKEDWKNINTIIKEANYEKKLANYAKEKEIPMSFIFGRLAKEKKVKYSDKLYKKYTLN